MPLGRVTITAQKRDELLDAFERSGLNCTQFARLAGVNYGTFASWVQDRRHSRGEYPLAGKPSTAPPKPIRLMEARVAEPASLTPPTDPMEVQLPDGSRVFIANSTQVALAAQLINALRTPC